MWYKLKDLVIVLRFMKTIFQNKITVYIFCLVLQKSTQILLTDTSL